MIASLLIAAALQSAAAPAHVPPPIPATACTAEVPPPAGFGAWRSITAATAGPIAIGARTGVKLAPAAATHFVIAPERKPAEGSLAGVYHVTVTTPGTYRIALDGAAWIDLVRDGAALPSTAHTMGPACTGIRKIVDFALVPGDYALQLSGVRDKALTVLIVPAR
ncbi:MAG: hypothetical protein WC804_16455 [Sphingomonas sp.]|jgi:hypothetical protein|uniref:hypothetical protein n=1 Tax=Sphingomonas sp. TaxID=28214 RepID=UPI003566D06A